MRQLALRLYDDENGFVVSAELVLITTIGVLSLLVGLAEVANAVNQELEDVGSAFGSVNQSYRYAGMIGHKGYWSGSFFHDHVDACDSQWDLACDIPPLPECAPMGHFRH